LIQRGYELLDELLVDEDAGAMSLAAADGPSS